MPRIARVVAPGYPHHVTQRGNNRATVFYDDEDHRKYLHFLSRYAKKYSLDIWAYCLMDNHVHLLAVPQDHASLAKAVGLTNQVYTQYLNRKLGNSGRVWQNRFFSCVVDHQAYLWAVARYIEQNPLKAGLVKEVADYQWSSGKAHIMGTADDLLSETAWFDPSERQAYVNFAKEVDEVADKAIDKATNTGRPFGSEKFVDLLEVRLNAVLRTKKPGRPLNRGSVPN
jgi:putative transposase